MRVVEPVVDDSSLRLCLTSITKRRARLVDEHVRGLWCSLGPSGEPCCVLSIGGRKFISGCPCGLPYALHHWRLRIRNERVLPVRRLPNGDMITFCRVCGIRDVAQSLLSLRRCLLCGLFFGSSRRRARQ